MEAKLKIPEILQPEDKGNYYMATCPKCLDFSLFCYKNSITAKCNRINTCVGVWVGPRNLKKAIKEAIDSGTLKPLAPKKKSKRKNKRVRGNKKKGPKKNVGVQKKEKDFKFNDPDTIERAVKNALGKKDSHALEFLEDRIPGIDPYNDIIKKGYAGATYAIYNWLDLNEAYKLIDKGYRLLTPLYNIKTNRIVSAQTRFCKNDYYKEIPVNSKDKEMKTRSFARCPYGKGGATFGSLKSVLKKADKVAKIHNTSPYIILAEGDVDYLTLKACGYNQTVGVPGVGQAIKVIQHLMEIEWKGIVYLSLDGDKAGNDSVEKIVEIVKSSKYNDLILMNARPKKGMDINDIYNFYYDKDKKDKYIKDGGKKALQYILSYAKPIKFGKEFSNKMADNVERIKLKRLGLWAYGVKLSKISKDRIINTIQGSGGKKSPIKPLARAATCGEFKQCEMSYPQTDKKGLPKKVGVKTRVAESGACSHCGAVQWNLGIAPYILDNWPDQLYYTRISFIKDDYDDFVRVRKMIMREVTVPWEYRDKQKENPDYAQSMFIIPDFKASEFLIITGATDMDDFCHYIIRNRASSRVVDKKELMKQIKDAYMSYSEYVNECTQNYSDNLIDNRFLSTKFKRYFFRRLLEIPRVKDLRDRIREKRADQFSASDEPERYEDGFSVFVTYREDHEKKLKRISAISLKSISYKNLVKKEVFEEEMEFDPTDPLAGNFLDNPRLSPMPVENIIEDFYWMTYGEGPDFNKVPGYKRPPKTKDVLKQVKAGIYRDPSLDDQSLSEVEFYLLWGNSGYNSEEIPLSPGSFPREWLEYPPESFLNYCNELNEEKKQQKKFIFNKPKIPIPIEDEVPF